MTDDCCKITTTFLFFMTALAFSRTCKTTQRNFMRWKLKGTYKFGRHVDNVHKKSSKLIFPSLHNSHKSPYAKIQHIFPWLQKSRKSLRRKKKLAIKKSTTLR